jgi:hypothetical protein
MSEEAEVTVEAVAVAVEKPELPAGASGAMMNSIETKSDEDIVRRPRDEEDDENVWDIDRDDKIVDDEADDDDEEDGDDDEEEEELDLGIDEGDDS